MLLITSSRFTEAELMLADMASEATYAGAAMMQHMPVRFFCREEELRKFEAAVSFCLNDDFGSLSLLLNPAVRVMRQVPYFMVRPGHVSGGSGGFRGRGGGEGERGRGPGGVGQEQGGHRHRIRDPSRGGSARRPHALLPCAEGSTRRKGDQT